LDGPSIDSGTIRNLSFGSRLQAVEARHFLHAGRTPGCPEVKEDDFAAQVTELHRLVVGVLDLEVGQGLGRLGELESLHGALGHVRLHAGQAGRGGKRDGRNGAAKNVAPAKEEIGDRMCHKPRS
jgi:hypothetical protein